MRFWDAPCGEKSSDRAAEGRSAASRHRPFPGHGSSRRTIGSAFANESKPKTVARVPDQDCELRLRCNRGPRVLRTQSSRGGIPSIMGDPFLNYFALFLLIFVVVVIF